MQPPSIPDDESLRLQALHDLSILDTSPEERFDRLTRLARHLFHTEIALVSLVDEQRQWFKSRQGLSACETGRDVSFCGHAILGKDIFQITDATQDLRFADNPLVTGAPHIRFYAGAPLSTVEGHRIGTLCIVDSKPRALTAQDLQSLRDLADCVEEEVNQARLQQQKRALSQAQRLGSAISRAQAQFIQQSDRRTAFDGLLTDVLDLTRSEYGFVGEVLCTPAGDPYLKTYSITDIAWNDATRAFYDNHAPQGMEFFNLKTLFGAALTSARAVIANDPCRDPRRGGLPEGHPPLHAFLGIPIHYDGRMVAMLGLANRPGGYDQQLVDFLAPLLATIGQLVNARRDQDKLRSSEEQFRSLVMNTPGAAYQCALDADWTMHFISDAIETLTGYPATDFIGNAVRSYASVIHPEDVARVDRDVNAAVNAGTAWEMEYRVCCKDGLVRWVYEKGRAIAETDSRVAALSGFIHDITERKQAEHALREARDAALAVAKMKSEFVATMSHEIRTPMNGVLGMAQVLGNTPLNVNQRQYVDTIVRSGKALLNVLNDILDFSKIEAGRLDLERVDFNLERTVTEVVELYHEQAINKRLELFVHYAPEGPRYVTGDPGRVRQILLNLVGNALKFTETGHVLVDVGVIERTADRARLHLAVTDTGVGLSLSAQTKLFQSFSQADASTTRKFGGTGLGLAICKRLVELMGGEIGVASTPGEGSTFWFSVPFAVANPGSGAVTENRGSGQARNEGRVPAPRLGGRVLLAEDVDFNQTVVAAMLQQMGVEVNFANNGAEAVRAMDEGHYSLILMDCHMPLMDGYEATARIRAGEQPGSHIPIIALTANALETDRQRCLDAGMDDFIPKPIEENVLRTKLARWLGDGADQSQAIDRAVARRVAAVDPVAAEPELCSEIQYQKLEKLMGTKLGGLVDSFLANSEIKLGELEAAAHSGDAKALHAVGHALRGICGTIGATLLHQLAGELERRGEAGDIADAVDRVAELKSVLVRTRGWLKSRCSPEAALHGV